MWNSYTYSIRIYHAKAYLLAQQGVISHTRYLHVLWISSMKGFSSRSKTGWTKTFHIGVILLRINIIPRDKHVMTFSRIKIIPRNKQVMTFSSDIPNFLDISASACVLEFI